MMAMDWGGRWEEGANLVGNSCAGSACDDTTQETKIERCLSRKKENVLGFLGC